MSVHEKSALYPNATWEDSFEFIKTIDSFKLKTVAYKAVAEKYGLSSISTKSFTSKISASKQFGLITTNSNTIQITDIGLKLLYPTNSAEQQRSIILNCFSTPPLYSKLLSQYDGKALPDESTLGNILMSEHKITRAVKDYAARCFIESANQLELIRGGVLCYTDQYTNINNSQIATSEATEYTEEVVPSNTSPLVNTAEESDYIIQNIPVKSGKIAKFIIPIESDEDDLLLLRDMFDVILKRKFKIGITNN